MHKNSSEENLLLLCSLEGERFGDHAVSLDVLSEFLLFEELIRKVARLKFLEDSSDSQFVSKEFLSGIALKLTEVRENSTSLSLISTDRGNGLFPATDYDYYKQALDEIIDIIKDPKSTSILFLQLPEEILNLFVRFSKILRDNEKIEISTPNQNGKSASLTAEKCKLLLSRLTPKKINEEITIRGLVSEADQEKMTFKIQLATGQSLKAPIPKGQLEKILKLFNDYKKRAVASFNGTAKYNHMHKLLEFNQIKHISILNPLNVELQIDDLKNLKDGWLNGEGLTLNHDDLNWLSQAFTENYFGDLPLPYLYPTVEGEVQAEWHLQPWDASVEINMEKHVGLWYLLNLETEKEEERELDLDDRECWEWLAGRLRSLTNNKNDS